MNDEIFSAEEKIKTELARCIDVRILRPFFFEGHLLTHCIIIPDAQCMAYLPTFGWFGW